MKIILILQLFCYLATSQIINSDFEYWTDLKDHIYQEGFEIYNIYNAKTGKLSGWNYNGHEFGIAISEESVSGEKALIIHNWYSYAPGEATYKFKPSELPSKLIGYYKFYQQEPFRSSDDSRATIAVNYFDELNDTLHHQIHYYEGKDEFTKFEIPIDFDGDLSKVDSISFVFRNSINLMCGDVGEWADICNLFFIDNLSLNFEPNSVENSSNNYNIFPNPANDFINIKTDKKIIDIELYNNYERIKVLKNKKIINISELSPGIYFLKISTVDSNIISKFIKI
jgi:hypothetical protein